MTFIDTPFDTETDTTDFVALPDWTVPEQHRGDWTEVRVEFPRLLTTHQALHAAGAIGYAFRQHLNGERLSFPSIQIDLGGWIDNYGETDEERFRGLDTIVTFWYDSRLCRRRGPADIREAFAAAAKYVVEGSPVRQSDGQRLSEGIGEAGDGARFFVR